MNTIPHLIHQSWKTANIPAEFSEYVETWKANHPTWEYRLWTDDDNYRLVKDHYDWLLPTYESYPLAIQRADMARVLYMHHCGGLYVDLDFECFRPFDELTDKGRIFLGREKGGLGWYKRGLDYACNALLASPAGESFWLQLLESLAESARPKRLWESRTAYVLSTTGPQILDRAIESYVKQNDDLHVYDQNCFYPASAMEKDPQRRRQLAQHHHSHAVHHFANSWFSTGMNMLMWLGYYFRRPFAPTRQS